MLHESSLLVLHHDDCVTECSDTVSSAGTCETCCRLNIVAFTEDTRRVYVTIRVDLSAADESDHTVSVMKPFIRLEAYETNVRPLYCTVSHETVITYGTRYLYR